MYETFEHTADVGLRIRTSDLDSLFEEAARALFAVIVANPETVRPVQQVAIELRGTRLDDLLFDWLAELLYLLDTRHMLFSQFEVHIADNHLTATVHGEPIDAERHTLAQEVKAITYHALKVERTTDGWLAEVIVDL